MQPDYDYAPEYLCIPCDPAPIAILGYTDHDQRHYRKSRPRPVIVSSSVLPSDQLSIFGCLTSQHSEDQKKSQWRFSRPSPEVLL